MKYNKQQITRASKHTDIQREPHRVAARLEGIQKNKGTTPKKKERTHK